MLSNTCRFTMPYRIASKVKGIHVEGYIYSTQSLIVKENMYFPVLYRFMTFVSSIIFCIIIGIFFLCEKYFCYLHNYRGFVAQLLNNDLKSKLV